MSLFAELTSSVNAVRPGRTRMLDYDAPLIVAVLGLLMFGTVMVYSASVALPDSPRFALYSPFHFVARHGIFIVIGLVAGVMAFSIPMERWQRWAIPLFLVSLLLLTVVLVPGIGREVNGASRWIPLGFFNVQPSEIMKVAAVIYAADYTVRKQAYMHELIRGFLPMSAAMVTTGVLLLLEPDMGAFVVIVMIAMGTLFLGGINGKLFGGLAVTMIGSFVMLIWLSPWRRERLFAYLDPWTEANALGKGYQLSHSLIAFGRGEWFGVGLGASIEKLYYLPEAHTDFLMAVVGEELGFVGVASVIAVFYFIVRRGFEIGRQAIAMDRTFSGLVAKGVAMWMGVQAFINMGVNTGLLPTKGLTLPLMSYGGSGIIMNIIALSILLRVDYENRVLMRGGRP